MSTEPFIGEIKLLGFNFAPRGYNLCNGQSLPISVYTALFSLIGTQYGGDGISTFNIPDLQGRVPIGQGQGPGLPNYVLGEKGGSETATLQIGNMPAHIHDASGIHANMPVSTGGGDSDSPQNAFLANTGAEVFSSVASPGANYGSLATSGNTGATGSSNPFSIMNPYLVMNYSIALEGIFPSRN